MRNDIKEARLKKGLSQVRLGKLIGKDQAAISRYESGILAIDVPTAPLIAKALDMDILAILYPASAGKKRAA